MRERRQTFVFVLTALSGTLGCLPGAAGAFDPLALLAWLVLLAPAAGAWCGALGIRPWPFGFAVPVCWAVLIAGSELLSARDLATPAFAACAVAGLFLIGLALGWLVPARPWATSGLCFFASLLASGLAIRGAFVDGAPPWAESHPKAAALLLDLSPLVLATDCAGFDWVHAHPDMYALSGVEWFQRQPWRGPLAGPAVLVVGCVLAQVAHRRFGASRLRKVTGSSE